MTKKSLASAVLALALTVVGVAPAAHATGSNAGSQNISYYSENGPLSSASIVVGNDVTYGNISARLVPNSGAWAAIQNTTAVLTPGGGATIDGTAATSPRYYAWIFASDGANIRSSASTGTTSTYAVPASASVGSASININYSFGTGGLSATPIAAGTYAFTPSLLINGVAANLADYTVTYYYSLNHTGSFTATADATYVNKSNNTCVNTTGYAAGDVLTITQYNNGVAGFTNGGQMSSGMYGVIDRAAPAAPDGSMPNGSGLADLANQTSGVYTYTLTNADLNTLLLLNGNYYGNKAVSGAETFDISVTRSGTEVTTPCFASAAAAPTVDTTGANLVITASNVALSGFSSLYSTRCYATPASVGPGPAPTTSTNNVCTMGTTSASTTYNAYYQVTLVSNQVYISARSASVSTVGAQGGNVQQVQVQAPQVVFNQPKFEIPAKIAISASGKVSLTGKDMGVTSVVVGGKEQKIDVNSTTKLDFDTTGLAKGVHDLVMKGAFGTYTVQKAIQVGEAVVTKVTGISARTVNVAGGELSISGQGLEGTTAVTMNGQILEIVSKTDALVTFKVPASTLTTRNSIKIEGSFVPVIFKNAFTYNK